MKLGGGGGKNEVQKKNWNHGEKNWEGGKEKIKLQKKNWDQGLSRLRKCKEKESA